MARTLRYATVEDLLIGQIPTPAYIDKQKFVDDACDEIDSYLGARYVTPIVLQDGVAEQRPGALMLKRIAAHLASGRLLLAAAAGGEDTEVHAYGWSLIRDATAALKALAAGNPIIVGALPATGDNGSPLSDVPIIANVDRFSQVEAFYDLQHPGGTLIDPYTPRPILGGGAYYG